jgi:cob(I)alamin adenosyltransferase
MKIYTKTGDAGQTGLFGGQRVRKDHARIEAYGTLDELNACIGILRDHLPETSPARPPLLQVQERLFSIGAHLATPAEQQDKMPLDLRTSDLEALETGMDTMDAQLPPLRNFILPGGHPVVAYAHLCRTVCRRAERLVVSLSEQAEVAPLVLQYLNRLSDYFFVLARYLGQELGVAEVNWRAR